MIRKLWLSSGMSQSVNRLMGDTVKPPSKNLIVRYIIYYNLFSLKFDKVHSCHGLKDDFKILASLRRSGSRTQATNATFS